MIPEKVINENEYRLKNIEELESLRNELSLALQIPKTKENKLRDDVNLRIVNDLIREKE